MECSMLPFGYKFQPTDQDLIKHLQHKAAGNPLPSLGLIEERDLYNTEPDDLFRRSNKEVRYFFVKPEKKKVKGGTRFRRTVGTKATWKGSNKGSLVHDLRGTVVGLQKNFVCILNSGENGKGIHGGYIMDEFRLKDSIPNIVLCRVKKRPQQKNDQDQDQDRDLDDNTSEFSMISEDVNHDEGAIICVPTADQGQDVAQDLIDIDELSPHLDDQESSKQLINEDHHQSPPVELNIEDDCEYHNTMAMINIDQNGHGSFATEELVPCISFGASERYLSRPFRTSLDSKRGS